ncbi:peptidase [Gardnerella vaginalis]|uniref:Peptidase n=1 Tax=Gardnerella vaginalis TaxID=2702 RepID=A0A3E1IQK5_GARVA|nr:FIVAR domain-containing protein [Gardnerella vaginalis]RFD75053.1 peptidase [Gardnerella vaginalis]
MASSNSRKHARKVTLDAAVSNAIEKAVDARKVAAFTVGAAGVLAGAAFAFGATPAMAAEAGAAGDPTDATQTPVTAGDKAGADAGKKAASKDNEAKEAETQDDAKKDQTDEKDQKKAESDKKEDTTEEQNKQSVAKTDDKKSDEEEKKQEITVVGTDREASAAPEPKPQANSTIKLSKDTKDTLPNMYAWGKSDNVYIEEGQNTSVTFTFAKPDDGYTITKVAIFPSDGNTVENDKSRKYLEYYSAGNENDHQAYSGTYDFQVNANDGTATLTMTKLYREGGLKNGESYSANRCIYVYGKGSDDKEVVLYKTNIVRAATLIPPKTAGSIVLEYDQPLTEDQIQAKLKQALDAPTTAKGGKSVREQIVSASKSNGVGGRTGANGAFVQTPDNPEKKVVITDKRAYLPTELDKINKVTSQTGEPTTYVTGVNNLKTYLVSDLGYKSEALALTVARYDTRIDKPIVEDTDPSKVSDEVKTEIKKKLAQLNHVSQDKVTIGDDGTVTINFDGVDAKDAPKLNLSDLVLKQLKEADVNVPTGEKAVFVANPLDYSKDEIARIKKAIYEANKDNKELGLSETDYEKQITLEYLKGNLTATGSANTGISNGMAENKITVKIKTDKAVAEFKSDVTTNRLTRLPNIRTDYTVSWEKDKSKIQGRDSDEGLSWSEDHKTIIYRYDPTKATAFKSDDVIKLLKATPNDKQAGLRELTGGEVLGHEGSDGKDKKSHVHYVIDSNGEPTGALTLGIMSGGYWRGDPQITGTEVDRGNVLSKTDEYKWDDDAKPVTLASKDGKIYRARLFVAPYGMETYQHVYAFPDKKNLNNTPKAINFIFVPQTNHKTSDLKKSVEGHKLAADKKTPIDSAYYNASKDKKDAYDEALKEANAALEAAGNTEDSKLSEALKARIDNATITLNKARAELDGPDTDKEKLKASIDENGKAEEGKAPTGTQATNQFKNVSDPDFKKADGSDDTDRNNAAKEAKKAYDKALEDAKTLNDDENATQKAVDDAKAKLDAARAKLNDFTTNKDELSAAIAKDGKVNTGRDAQGTQTLAKADPTYQNSTTEQQKAYDDAVAQADKVSKDPNASQKEVNKAIEDLKKAKAALDANATDKSPLDAAVQKSFDNPKPGDESQQSVFYKNAKGKTNDPDAQQAVKNYDDALKKAKDVLANDKATKKDVEEAKKALEAAEAALHADKYSTDKTDLGKALADNFSGYLMPAYFNAFDKAQHDGAGSQAAKDFKAYNDAYHAAKDLMEDLKKPDSTVDQKKVDAVKNQLIEARKVIDKYATDTSKISAALLHSLAITKSPAYLNASAGAEGSEEAKAKKAYDDALKALQDAFNDKMPQDTVDGKPDSDPISTNNIPAKDGDTSSPDYLKSIQSHAKGQPLNRDVTKLLAKLNDAVKGLDKFKTKTDELIESINKDSDTHPSPAFKNASVHNYLGTDGNADSAKNTAARKAATDYGKALNEAKDLLNNPNATQKDINDAKAALDNARKELDKYNTDTTKLKESVKKHGTKEAVPAPEEGTLTSDAYRNASDPHFLTPDGKPDDNKNKQAAADKKAYDAALLKAQELLKKADPDSKTPLDAQPTQKEIDEALKNLDDARKKLEDNYKTVTTDLENEIKKSTPETAQAAAEGDFEYTPEFKNADAKKDGANENADVKAYKEALKKARDLAQAANPIDPAAKNSSHPTQKQINDALDALKQAKQAIIDGYKTDVDKLKQAKEYAEDVFKKTPEYKNATAIKNDNNNAKHEQAGKDLDGTDQKPGLSKLIEKIATKLQDTSKMTQKEVDALVKQLVTAQKKITENYKTDVKLLSNEVGDKDAQGQDVTPPFEASVAYKNALAKKNAGDATATEKLNAYAEKLAEAQKLIDQVNSTDQNADPDKKPTQKQVDDALAALKQAKKDIDDNFKTKVDKLQDEVDDKDEHGNAKQEADKFENSTEFKNLNAKIDGDKKPDDLVAYEQALAKAKELIKKNTGKMTDPQDPNKEVDVPKDQLPSQKEVDDALQTLKEIKEKILANYKTSPNDLYEEVDKSKNGDTDTSTDVFENTPAFKNADAAKDGSNDNADMKAYKDALEKAKGMLEKFDRATGKPKKDAKDVPTQKQLDDALKALQDAKKKIEDNYSTSKSDLRTEAGDDFTNSPEYQNAQAKGDDASKQALDEYKNALEDANSVLADPNATQAEVDAALKRLQDAKAKLKAENGTDKSKLQDEADDDANFRKSPYFIIGNKADIEAYEDALAEARRVLNDPNATQAQVDAALKKLEDAKKRILDFLSHFGGSGKGTGDYGFGEGNGFVNGHESYGALVDKSALQIEVNNAVDANANTAQAVAYRQALAEAKSVLNDPNATQAQVDAALRKLQAAKAALLNSLSGASGHKIAKTGAATGLFAGFAVIFAGLGAAGVASRRRKHSKE